MTTALIAEDEAILAQTLANALHRLWPDLRIVATVGNGVAAVQETLALRPDIVFFDIKMPGKSGLDAAHELADEWPDGAPFPLIVFVTAYDQYALEAFEHAAADYVLKPVNDARLAKTVERLRARIEQGRTQAPAPDRPRDGELERAVAQLRSLLPAQHVPAEKLTIIRAAVGNQIRMIPIDEVVYLEATDKYVNVVTADSESLIRTSLRDLIPQLDGTRFWQIHRSYVVNVKRIDSAVRDDAGKLSLKLRGRGETLPVSRVFAHLFKQM
ncbi:MAG TPA: LytTR family DNA-binding domain-containing protein [Paucimonas sp.]|nr:LytTR family DNA-binding domain-containing protein [Paucimonas sp.]